MANRLRSHLRHFSGWAARRGYISTDIGAIGDRPYHQEARDVPLTIPQARLILETADTLRPVWGTLVKMLVLTGQRNAEIRALKWAEIDLENALSGKLLSR